MTEKIPDPFAQDIVYEPRRVSQAVRGLNVKPLRELLLEFTRLIEGPLPRSGKKLEHAQFVTSPEPGYGKSHLIGRLFRILVGKANLIYVSPFEDSATSWKSILLRMIQELEFPDRLDVEYCHDDEPSQLEALAHGVVARLVVGALEKGAIGAQRKDDYIRYLLRAPVTRFRRRKVNIEEIRKKTGVLVRELKGRMAGSHASVISWLNVLFQYAYYPEAFALRETCLDWLKGGSIDNEEAERIGIRVPDVPSAEMTAGEINELCKGRIMDLCHLAGFHRPFVFCFDQTENYVKDPQLAKELGIVTETLGREGFNLMTVITANVTPWEEVLKPQWEDAHLQRLRFPSLELEGLDRKQAEELIGQRLDGWAADRAAIDHMFVPAWLDDLFKDVKEIGVRHFLRMCSARWRQQQTGPVTISPTLEDLYQTNIEVIKSQPRRLVFNPDALYWLVFEVASTLPGVSVEKEKGRKGYFVLTWKTKAGHVYFGFESGSHWRRWKAITEEAGRLHQRERGVKTVIFRTRELSPIPKKTWKKVGGLIEEARKSYLDIVRLNREEMAQIYAAHDLYLDAVGGNIDYQPARVLGFVRDKLKTLWERLLKLPSDEPENGPAMETPPRALIEEVRRIVNQKKFMSFSDLMASLSEPYPEELVQKARGCIPEIKIKTSPGMTVLLWQPGR